mgnify:CR=1 FL=1
MKATPGKWGEAVLAQLARGRMQFRDLVQWIEREQQTSHTNAVRRIERLELAGFVSVAGPPRKRTVAARSPQKGGER